MPAMVADRIKRLIALGRAYRAYLDAFQVVQVKVRTSGFGWIPHQSSRDTLNVGLRGR